MNLAFLTKQYDTVGGTERDLYELTRRLALNGHDIHVYCYDRREDPPEGIRIHDVPICGISRNAKLRALAHSAVRMAYSGGHDLIISFAKVCKQDIVRCEGGTHKQFLIEAGQQDSALKQLTRRLSPYHRNMLRIERQQYKPSNFRRILAISKSVKADIIKAYDVPADSIEVVYSGIDASRFHPDNITMHRKAVRHEYNIGQDAYVVLFLGNGFRRKGLDHLLQALAQLHNEKVDCLVVGSDAKLSQYQKQANQCGLAGRVRFAGVQPDPERFFAASDLFVLPSRQEGFGNVTLEAMATGIPAIVSGCAGSAEVVGERFPQWIIKDPANHRKLAEKIAAVMKSGNIAKETRQLALAYSLDANAKATEEIYEQVLAEKREKNNYKIHEIHEKPVGAKLRQVLPF